MILAVTKHAGGQAGTADPENDVATNEPGGTSSHS